MTKTRPRFKSDIRIKKDTPKAAAKPDTQPCAVKNCDKPGNCRVPKSRENLSDYLFLCTAHARAFLLDPRWGWNAARALGVDTPPLPLPAARATTLLPFKPQPALPRAAE